MLNLPNNVVAYKRTKTFTNETVPKALLNDHSTKQNVWGKLMVESGSITYLVTEVEPNQSSLIQSGEWAVIAPEQQHHIQLHGNVKFYIEFYK